MHANKQLVDAVLQATIDQIHARENGQHFADFVTASGAVVGEVGRCDEYVGKAKCARHGLVDGVDFIRLGDATRAVGIQAYQAGSKGG